jgi:Fur family transcriptional regulator, ferric uptake regulator
VASTDWKSDLRQRGYRLTPQRELVLEAVDNLEHATPDGILCEVRKTASGVNISTVYRTLELLEELGLVSHAHLGHGAPTYHLADRLNHLHLVCRDCEAVTEADVELAASLKDGLRSEFGFETDMKHFAIFGRCRDCARKAAAAGGAGGIPDGPAVTEASAAAGPRGGTGGKA